MRFEQQSTCPVFSLDEIQSATADFDESLVIGKGSFGKVYKGEINDELVAVKRLFYTPNRDVEFRKEIETVSQIRHCRLISLLGYCQEKEEFILIYEYMPRGSLDKHLYDDGNKCGLTWKMCLKICIGIADGLQHLHQGIGLDKIIIHGDIKSANVLLDENFEAKISDFGLSTVVSTDSGQSQVQHTTLKFTPAYVDPHYRTTGKLSKQSDVYSFGILLLEVLLGKIAFDQGVRDCLRDGRIHEFIDSDLLVQIPEECLQEFVNLSLNCLQRVPRKRPKLIQVLAALDKLDKWQERTISSKEFLEDSGRGYDTTESLRFDSESESNPSSGSSFYIFSWNTKDFEKVIAAAKVIQIAFRAYIIRKKQAIQAHQDLVQIKAELKEYKALFNNFSYRRRVADDTDERQQFIGRIIVLLLTVGANEGADFKGRAEKRSIESKLKAMYAELVAPDPGQKELEKGVEKVFAKVMTAVPEFKKIKFLFNSYDYQCFISRDKAELEKFRARTFVLILLLNDIQGDDSVGRAVKIGLVDKLEALYAELAATYPEQRKIAVDAQEVFSRVITAVTISKRKKQYLLLEDDAARVIQIGFKTFSILRGHILKTHPVLAMAMENLKKIRIQWKRSYYKRSPRKRVSQLLRPAALVNDEIPKFYSILLDISIGQAEKEHKKSIELITQLISTVDALCDVDDRTAVRYAKWLVMDLKVMIQVIHMAVAKDKLKTIKDWFNNPYYRHRLACDPKERQKIKEWISALIVTVQAIEVADETGITAKRSMMNQLQAMSYVLACY